MIVCSLVWQIEIRVVKFHQRSQSTIIKVGLRSYSGIKCHDACCEWIDVRKTLTKMNIPGDIRILKD